ncbi:hypothetical protein HDE68_005038 [Pedobacter cryoconitis]|uniref:Uncharacterized protein n=1 Tax=Pedobacter cryoconitis TaxID=188932 RepID=A0A7W9E2Q8_9SPHI|nr:hypothetical protein [Pedobacter cryoconitis]MBB5639100.1 hypothetical protein [Pedobacter cryoconitis]
MSNQQTPEKTVIDEVVESLIKKTELLEKELSTMKEALLAKEEQTQALLIDFEKKISNMVIQAPAPDLSEVNATLKNGLAIMNQSMEKWPKPLKKEYRFLFFSEQLRSVEYVRAVLTRIILGSIGLVFLIFAYLLMDKHIQ